MGKISNKKHRVHFEAPRPAAQNEEVVVTRDQWAKNSTGIPVTNIFKNIRIPTSALKQRLPSFKSQAPYDNKYDQRNATLQLVATKLQLQKIKGGKRKPVHKVVKEVLEEQIRMKKEMKRRKKAILHSYNTLKDALPSLNDLKKSCETQEKARNSKSKKTQAVEMEEDIETFRNNLKSSSFVSDPFKEVTAHIKSHLSS